jgi:hypothetical protein
LRSLAALTDAPSGGRAVGGRYPMAPAVGEVAPIPAVEMSVS